jgi:hypothetical protein
MEIKLDIVTGKDEKGEDIIKTNTYVAKNPKARLVRRVLEIEKEYDFNHFTPDSLDVAVDFICEIYKDKFTRDELYEGLDSDKLLLTYRKSADEIINGVTSKLATFPTE